MRLTRGKVLFVVLPLAALVAVGFVRHQGRVVEQNRLARIASDLAGRQVGVRCPSFVARLVDTRGEAGRVRFDGNGKPAGHTDLSPETCDRLRSLDTLDLSCFTRGDCGYRQFQAGWAAHTLAHESFHLRGYQDEGVTECYALQQTAFVAIRLGVAPAVAVHLQQWLFAKGYPNEPQEYHSPDCYAGGPLDLRPESPRWP